MSNVKIKKASIKDSLFLNVEYSEFLEGHSKKETKLSCTVPIHEDLRTSFEKLHKHLAILCDEEKAPKNSSAFQNATFEKFGVRGFSIGGSDESEGVTVSGFKEGKYGMVNLNTPFTKFESEDYPFLTELTGDVDECISEVEAYLFDGKRAPESQLELAFGEDLDETETETQE